MRAARVALDADRGALAGVQGGPEFQAASGARARSVCGRESSAAGTRTAALERLRRALFLVARVPRSRARRARRCGAAGNLDLKGAYLRIVEARIQVQAARAQGLPSLDASASYTREQLGLAGILKSQGIGTASGPTSSPRHSNSSPRSSSPSTSISWDSMPRGRSICSARCAARWRPRTRRARGRRIAQRPAGVARGGGRADLFPVAREPSAAANHAAMKSPRSARSPISRKTGTCTVSPASPTWNPRVRSSRAWSRNCRRTSRRSRPRDTRSPCSSDKPPSRSMPDSGITENCRHCRRVSRWGYPRPWRAGGPTSEIPRRRCMPPPPRSAYPSRALFPDISLAGTLRIAQSRHPVSIRLVEPFLHLRPERIAADFSGRRADRERALVASTSRGGGIELSQDRPQRPSGGRRRTECVGRGCAAHRRARGNGGRRSARRRCRSSMRTATA